MFVLTLIIVFVAIVLVAVVLVQKSKGGGLAAGFQSSNQIMGAPKTANFLEKLTWSLMGAIAVLCIASTLIISNADETTTGSSLKAKESNEVPVMPEGTATTEAPATENTPAEAPTEAPAETPAETPAQ